MTGILWTEMKSFLRGSKAVFILLILAFTCSCITVNIVVWNYLYAREYQQAVEEDFGDETVFNTSLDGEESVVQRMFSKEYRENIKAAFEQLKEEPSFQYRYGIGTNINFTGDESYGRDDFPAYKKEFLSGYEEGVPEEDDDCLSLKVFYIDRLFKNGAGVKLESGEWPEDHEYYADDPGNLRFPVILGSGYKELYKIGDEISDANMGPEKGAVLYVKGFLEQGSWAYDYNNEKQILDRYMIVPSPEVGYNYNDYREEDGEYDEFFRFCYDTDKIMNTRMICDNEKADEVQKKIYEILYQNKLYEIKAYNESAAAASEAEEWKEQTVSYFAISVFTIIFSVFMFSVQTHYKLIKNRKKYGIYKMIGITGRQLFLIIILDTLLLFVLADILMVAANALLSVRVVPFSITTVVIIVIMEFILLCLMGIWGYRKVNKIDMSSALREHE